MTFNDSNTNLSPKIVWVTSIVFSVMFTLIIWYFGKNLQPFLETLLPDKGSSWYYWKLPRRIPETMIIVWSLYAAHQFSAWFSIYWAQSNLKSITSSKLSLYNYAVLSINVIFSIIHLIETHILFDGLAQDVPIWTSQGSVILMLVFVLIIENRRRGFFLGYKVEKPFTVKVTGFFRKIHTYVFSWALVYTFWFHPMAVDPQLLSGFIYMFFLFTQMSLAWTRIHLDPRWIIFLESYVAVHALIVAVYNTLMHGSADIWPMFFSGFISMLVFTYQYGLKTSKRVKLGLTAAYSLFLIFLYAPKPLGLGREISYLIRLEFSWIPIILYGLALGFGGFYYLVKPKR